MAKKTIATKLDEDGDLYQGFEKSLEEHETTSEAMRSLLRQGLNLENNETEIRLRRAIDGAEQSLRIGAYFTLIAAALTYAPIIPETITQPIAAALLIPASVTILISISRSFTAIAIFRAEGYGWIEMLRIAMRAHSPNLVLGEADRV